MMKRIAILLLLGWLAAACNPNESAPPSTETSPAPLEATSLPSLTVAPPADIPEPTSRPPDTPLTSDVDGPPMEGCTLQTLLAPPDATEVSLFQPVTADDWQLGPGDAATTIVEYGDFQ